MKLFSTEQVSKYHPDKVADQISDRILTECLKQDKNSHVAVETLIKGQTVVLGGEITTAAKFNPYKAVQDVCRKLNYKCDKVINLISNQSPEINRAVEQDENLGAGDQGVMFGYATNETESMLPFGFDLANKIIKRIENNLGDVLKGDAKTQVTVDLDTNEVKTILISVCHHEQYTLEQVKKYISGLFPEYEDKLLINPSGTWTIGGPEADCGLTGRKIVCDQYGGYCAVGGGAFSGKDPSKVDRSGSYMARHIACDLVKKFNLKWVEVQLGYAIGVAEPVSIAVKCDQETRNDELGQFIRDSYNLTPRGIINALKLLDINYEKLAEGCHYYKE